MVLSKTCLAVPAICLAGFFLLLTLFAGTLIGKSQFAFRDVSHFYLPLAEFLQDRQTEQRLPLWSRLDSFGVPLAGETTTALFYPPRILLFACLPSAVALSVYITLHLCWAGVGIYSLSKQLTKNTAVSAIAAFGYTTGGPVFFLYTNPPFLVGASWLPWIFLFLITSQSAIIKKSHRQLVLAAGCVAMSILGGDPQTPFHALMIWCLWRLVILTFQRASNKLRGELPAPTSGSFQKKSHTSLRRSSVNFLVLVTLATALAAPQIAASLSWSRQSHRSATAPFDLFTRLVSSPSLSAKGAESNSPKLDSIITAGEFSVRKHSDQVLDFSIAPWHLPEILSPYLAGKLFPINSRIAKLLPNEPRMWTPTLYCGFLPGICFLVTLIRPRHSSPWSSLALLSLAFALGQFGLYWLLVALIPEYGQFRFPAKWLPLMSLGICVHSACLLSRLKPQSLRSLKRFVQSMLVALGLLLVICCLPNIEGKFSLLIAPYMSNAVDRYWGPLSVNHWFVDLRSSLLQTLLLTFFAFVASALLQRQRICSRTFWHCLLILSIVDAFLVAGWQLAVVPSGDTSPHKADVVQPRPALSDMPVESRYLLAQTNQSFPSIWREQTDSQRAIEVQQTERQTWVGRWHLADNVAVINNPLSIPSHRAVLFWAALRLRLQKLDPSGQQRAMNAAAAYLSTNAVAGRDEGELSFVKIPHTYPFVRLHANWKVVPAIPREKLADELASLIDSIIRERHATSPDQHHLERDIRKVERPAKQNSFARVTDLRFRSDSIHFNVQTSHPSCLQIMQMQDGGWKAELTNQNTARVIEARVYPCDIVSQAVIVPAGRWQIRLMYEPAWWWPSLIVQFLALAAFVASLFRGSSVRQARHSQTEPTTASDGSR